ncbi:MAG: hypothetical protein KF871_00465 [Hydrogenophaga sp.]|uniref:hypothetical protein n=1 Tax=Hydrogenophaga sp. TaxID=1904254 RepID=UPI001DA3E236|nr:hypothetical protein [Hydrogenophaga sp.]MBX3608338.1 hypothetical protein [Hydrogenophaga sp.]
MNDQYTKHRWKFLLFGSITGVLMGISSPTGAEPSNLVFDLIGGLILWYILWRLWAWSKRRADRSENGSRKNAS